MAGMNSAPATLAWPEAREQFAAIAHLRWRIFINSLRTLRGRLELVSWIVMGVGYGIFAVGGTFGLGVASWYFVSRGRSEWLAAPLWAVLLYWQFFPLMATAFTDNFDSSNFLRFPLRYRSYFLIRVAYGSLDPATVVASLWLCGMAMGTAVAAPGLAPWILLVLAVFWMVNILLARLVFAWLERWLAQRRTREILGILFLLLIVGLQFIGPLAGHFGNRGARIGPLWFAAKFLPAERLLPPGLAAEAFVRAAHGNFAAAAGSLMLLSVFGGAFYWLLDMRLRTQFRGENLSEAIAPAVSIEKTATARVGWTLPGISGPAAAVFEKEFRYLSRSGPMLFNMLMPIVVLLIFRATPAGPPRGGHTHALPANLAFPVGAAYALLIFSNLIYNCFGTDGGGVQFFFVVPVRFREILFGKNLLHGAILTVEIALVWAATHLLFGTPPAGITFATLAGIFFAAMVSFSIGNVLSITVPKKIDVSVFGRQRAAGSTVLASLGVSAGILGLAAAVLLAAMHYGALWLATILFLALAALACVGYALVLGRADRLAMEHREAMIGELSRTRAGV